jgi:hypothetical protein
LIFHPGQRYYSVKSQHLSYSTGPEAEAGYIKRFGPHRVLFRTYLSHFRFAKPSDQGGAGMEQKAFHRKLTAILSADVAGYSRLMQDEEAATTRLSNLATESLATLFQKKIPKTDPKKRR